MDNQTAHFIKCAMTASSALHPTLWRTCRVLANRPRLKIFNLLMRTEPLAVSAVAERLNFTVPAASQCLRALEARGILTSRRVSRRVDYRLNTDAATPLAAPLRVTFQRNSTPIETVFKLATAFTHPRRVEIYRALAATSRTQGQLQAFTRISGRALLRHLGKLEARDFIQLREDTYHVIERTDPFGRALADLALG